MEMSIIIHRFLQMFSGGVIVKFTKSQNSGLPQTNYIKLNPFKTPVSLKTSTGLFLANMSTLMVSEKKTNMFLLSVCKKKSLSYVMLPEGLISLPSHT